MKNILLTYDYEVFFVKFGSVDNSLLIPTNELVKKMNGYYMKGTFFVDVLFMDYLRRQGNLENFTRIVEQLRGIVSSGHRIELHLHPHWIDTSNGIANFSRYKLHDFSEVQQSELFERGLEILYGVTNGEDSDYKVKAYRAGGWCIQPFESLKKTFTKFNIKIDSSVAYGMYQKTDSHFFDFRHVPEKEWYNFEDNIEYDEPGGYFVEIPISTFSTTPIEKIFKRWIARRDRGSIIKYGDGYGISVNKWILLRKLFENRAMFSIDGIFDVENMMRNVENYKMGTVNFISHPKNLTNYSLQFLDDLANTNLNYMTLEEYYKRCVLSA